VLSELAWCNYGFLPRKRPRLEAAPAAGGGFLEDQRVGTPPAGTERLLPVPPFVDVRNRTVGSGAASTSGRMANGAGATTVVSRELLSSWTHQHRVEIDALVALEVRTALFDRGFNLSIRDYLESTSSSVDGMVSNL
jgi:E3 ubiquitin-protein ligase BOI-like protein